MLKEAHVESKHVKNPVPSCWAVLAVDKGTASQLELRGGGQWGCDFKKKVLWGTAAAQKDGGT